MGGGRYIISQAKKLAKALWKKNHDIKALKIQTIICMKFPTSHIDIVTIKGWLRVWNQKRESKPVTETYDKL
jgi:hypothetical protein